MTLFVPVGRLASEPTTRESGKGRTCCSFSYAVDTGMKDGAGNKISNFLNVTAWGKLGEVAQEHLHKGDAVSITGKFCARQYESKKDGTTKTSLDLTATDIDFLPGGKKDGGKREDDAEEQRPKRRRQQAQQTYETDTDASDDEDELPF